MLVHWPHLHGNLPVRLDHPIPHRWQDDLAIRASQIVMTFPNMLPKLVDLHERLLDEFFHALLLMLVELIQSQIGEGEVR